MNYLPLQKLIKSVLVILVLYLVVFCLVACGSEPQTEPVQQAVSALPTAVPTQSEQVKPATIEEPGESYPAEQDQYEASTEPEGGFRQEWTLNTGDIDRIVVAADGQIYGLIHQETPPRHVAISAAGEIENVSELPQDNRFGWINRNIAARSDGTFLFSEDYDPDDNPLTSPRNQVIGEISPDGQLQVWDMAALPGDCTLFNRLSYYGSNSILGKTNEGGGPYCYYHLDDSGLVMDTVITVPEDHFRYSLNGGIGSNGHTVVSYEDHASGEIVHVNPDGAIVYRGKPQGLDLERNFDSYETPWGDLWLQYHEYDAVGADQGERIMRITADGSEATFDSFLPDSYPEAVTGKDTLFYLRDTGEIYFRAKDALVQLDQDYQVLNTYPFSQELDDALTPWSFVGYDGNIYTWEPHSSKELRKFVWVP